MIELTQEDRIQIKKKGLSVEDVEWQLENFKQGFSPLDLIKPATIDDGIRQLGNERIQELEREYTRNIADYYLMKFIPASGAASRMFKFLYEYLEDQTKNEDEVKRFINHLKDFAFFNDLKESLSDKGLDIEKESENGNYKVIIEELLYPDGLNYGNLPKALIKFHSYADHARTPMEEHMVESAQYATNVGNTALLHFTISPEHKDLFIQRLEQVKDQYARAYDMNYKVEHSFQKEKTDMVAVDMENNFIRNEDSTLLFRPGGHGALLENLDEVDANVVFIKNVDNVVPDHLKKTTNEYKRALAGLLIETQKKIFEYLRLMDREGELDQANLEEIDSFIQQELSVIPPENLNKSDQHTYQQYLYNILNRPIRVCGMVENQGEPGGGPFWVRDNKGRVTLQIVEMSQIDTENQDQMEIVNNSTHFNPVDLVCGIKDYKGRKFDLTRYRDPSAGIITKKSKGGQELKAQELPGLWNGGMAFWNTIFVEVPLITFTPVKTVNDLLRKEHQ